MNEETKIENLTKIEKITSSSSTIHSFQDYEIIQELPAGGAEADNFLIQKNHTQFFLKLYRKGINPNIELLINLKELSQKLKEHVVEIFDVGFDNQLQRYFEIMEFVPYGDIRPLIKEIQSLPQNEKFHQIDLIIKEMAIALKFLHDHDIIHRDLKPSNILIRNKNPLDLVFIDFGISKKLDEELSKVATTSFKGTIYYIAPEEISNYFGKEIDWWHLGIIIYELLTGKNPFHKLSEQAVINLLTTKNIEIPKNIPEKYQTLLKGLLTRNYEKRWNYQQVHDWLNGKTNIPVYFEETQKDKKRTTDSEKIWDKHGIPKDSPWRTLELEPEKVITFKQADFGVNEAKKWIQAGWTNGKSARKWLDNAFEPEEAYLFENFGLSIKQAKTLVSSGITAYDLKKIKNQIKDWDEFISETIILIEKGYNPGYVIKEYDQFINAGMSYREANDWVAKGFSLNEAIAWKNAGFSPNEAKDWKNAGFSLNDAKELRNFGLIPERAYYLMSVLGYGFGDWRNAGFTKVEAILWKNGDFSLNEAIKWRNANISANEAKDWKNAGFFLSYAKYWKNAGFSLNDVIAWKNAGFSLYDAKDCKNAGFSLNDAIAWKNAGFSLNKAIDWKNAGFPLNDAIKWKNAGFSPNEAKDWKNAGFSLNDAIDWKNANISANEVKYWRNAGFPLNEAKDLKKAGFSLYDAKDWKNAGFSPNEAKDWKNAGFSPNEAKDWKNAGFFLSYAKYWKNAGFSLYDAKDWKNAGSLNEAIEWKNAGFFPYDAKYWKNAGFSLNEAIKWKNAGFSLYDAKYWKNAGFSLNDAKDWKNAGFFPYDAKYWKNAGFSLNKAIDWKNAGFPLYDAKDWKKSGLSPNSAKKFVESNVPLKDAKFFKKLRKIIFTSLFTFLFVIGIKFISLISPYLRKGLISFMAGMVGLITIIIFFSFLQSIINSLITMFYRNRRPVSAKLFSIISIVLLSFILFLALYLMMYIINNAQP